MQFPIQVAFAEEGAVVVVGSDAGVVHVFRVADGEALCCLRHNARGMVQSVAVSRSIDVAREGMLTTVLFPKTYLCDGKSYIVAADGSPGIPGNITVWQHALKSGIVPSFGFHIFWTALKALLRPLEVLIRWAVLLAALSFFVENFVLVSLSRSSNT